jgi:hypothetical protein
MPQKRAFPDFEAIQVSHADIEASRDERAAKRQMISRTEQFLPAPLTSDNPLFHTRSMDPKTGIVVFAAPPALSSTLIVKSVGSDQPVRRFGVGVNTFAPCPVELAAYIEDVVKQNRGTQLPAVREVHRISHAFVGATDATVRYLLAPRLLFKGKLDDAINGEDHIRLDFNVKFDHRFVENGARKLSQPQYGACVGYIRAQHARGLTRALFTEEEEMVLLRHGASTTNETLYPFLTGHFESSTKSERIRDAIAFDTSMRELFAAADIIPTGLDTQHWSVTCDAGSASLYVHWSVPAFDGKIRFFMKEVIQSDLVNDNRLSLMMEYLRNILDYAVS